MGEKYWKDLDYFTEDARDDWGPVHNIFVSASNIAGGGASLHQIVVVAERMLQDLFTRQVRVGDLTERDPGFRPWQGTPDQWMTRIREDVEKRGDIPAPGELGWLHITK